MIGCAQVRLETVECILALHTPEEAAATAARRASGAAAEAAGAAAEGEEGGGGSAGGGWLGSFLQQALSNIRVVVSNLVLKYIAPEATATFTCKHVRLCSADDDWQSRLMVRMAALCCPALRIAPAPTARLCFTSRPQGSAGMGSGMRTRA